MQRRFVVRMGICIGDHYQDTEVNLVNRSGFNYDILIGRKNLVGKFIVDPQKKFTRQPRCSIK